MLVQTINKNAGDTLAEQDLRIFANHESSVRTYCRKFPIVFTRAKEHLMYDADGRAYIDFICGAGALNYGHNPDSILSGVIEYLVDGGIVHSMDLHTQAKRDFIEQFVGHILTPRKLNYRIQFTGPTGSNAVEAALKVARRVTGRMSIVAFSNGYHGTSLGALSVTANAAKREAAGVPLPFVIRLPYDGFLGPECDTAEYLERMVSGPGGGLDTPAAIIVETIQGEGGVHAARKTWLKRVADVAADNGILLIVDDIQAGCGRSGRFFSFEECGITPDIVCLSKSLSGMGLPFAITLIRPELDRQRPGEHSGTFRGHNLAFIGAIRAIEYWKNSDFVASLTKKTEYFDMIVNMIADENRHQGCTARGRGFLRGLTWTSPEMARAVAAKCFQRGMLIETAGPNGEVLKLMPPITIEQKAFSDALDVVREAINAVR